MRRVADASGRSLVPFIREVVAPGATVRTDSWRGYLALSKHGFDHASVNPSHVEERPSSVMPGVHRVASLLKRWLLGTLHGAVRADHMPEYLDEFVFRFNRRSSRARGLLFYRLLEQAVVTEVATYKDIRSSQTGSS